MDDPRLAELSGMAVDAGGLWAMTDGGRRVAVHRLDGADGEACRITDSRTADIDPFDAEDLALAPDGTLWVADVGDNDRARETVAVIALPPRGAARLHRLTYPDGPHDAEALLVDAEGVPFVITKEVRRPAGVYRPAGPPTEVGPMPMARVAELTLPRSDTVGGPAGALGSRLVTGAAMSVDGQVVALRSYTDAWLYAVPDGDLAAALVGTPIRVPLPGEPQGEAIAFEADGTLLTGSERRAGADGEIRAVAGASALVGDAGATSSAAPPTASEPVEGTPAWLPSAAGASVAVGLLALVAGLSGWRAARRGRR